MENTFKKIVAKELILLRKSKGYTSIELSKKASIATSTLSRYENGYGSMDIAIIEKIVSACDESTYIFFNKCVAKLQ